MQTAPAPVEHDGAEFLLQKIECASNWLDDRLPTLVIAREPARPISFEKLRGEASRGAGSECCLVTLKSLTRDTLAPLVEKRVEYRRCDAIRFHAKVPGCQKLDGTSNSLELCRWDAAGRVGRHRMF